MIFKHCVAMITTAKLSLELLSAFFLFLRYVFKEEKESSAAFTSTTAILNGLLEQRIG